ncbi:MAG: ribosome recycling factor [Candidatus Berkelbacteria bacterium Licking1014_7]|uniref:Ribosome recycling factor n=1 Tax=Candidatus Berkelbacteria bacterium Licking1014_7 TaxID=2017147 RepID=A0A554LIQ1_9BACT|nr:MAG: ribosome recycling factor [Candidatus Berkelbacteria bacterium Licking1014_7]
MLTKILENATIRMEQVVDIFKKEIAKLRTSRASAAMVEDILVEHYGSRQPLKTIATVTAPQANLIQIMPWDKSAISNIEIALGKTELGGRPQSDGNMIRMIILPMTGERREQLIKILRSQAEQARVTLRQAREEAWREIQDKEKTGDLTEDDKYQGKKELDKLTRKFYQQVDETVRSKEGEIGG